MSNQMHAPVIKPLVIKIGGAILEKESALTALLNAIAKLKNKQVILFNPKSIVHFVKLIGLDLCTNTKSIK